MSLSIGVHFQNNIGSQRKKKDTQDPTRYLESNPIMIDFFLGHFFNMVP